MTYLRNLIGIFIITILMSACFLIIGSDQARAQNGDICEITIEKVADPGDDTPFNFSVTGDENFGFTLSDPSDPTETFFIADGTVNITELVPPGWIVDGIECVDGQNGCGGPCLTFSELPNGQGVVATCLDNDAGSCTFTNFSKPRNIPTMSQWGMMALAVLFILVGIWAITRKKAEA